MKDKLSKDICDINMSWDESLYEEIEKILKVKNMIKKELCMCAGINRQVLSDIKSKRRRPTLKIVVSICIGLQLSPTQAMRLIETAGYKLNDNYPLDRAYIKVINEYQGKTVKQCNKLLKEIENEDNELTLNDSDMLGSKKSEKKKK